MITTALISVSDKTGLVSFAQQLSKLGVKILSTGGTAQLLREAKIAVTDVSDYTGFPEIMDGRVKTLHPKIHGGILARRDMSEHKDAMIKHGIHPIDLVVVNLYPFERTISQGDCSLEQAIEQIDIGGPSMLRAAAKNYEHVTVVCDPDDYQPVLVELAKNTMDKARRLELAQKVFAHTARYDRAIDEYLSATLAPATQSSNFPVMLNTSWRKVQDLRYGENPHQKAAFYIESDPAAGSLALAYQSQGKEISFNNLADADTAWECVKSFAGPSCVIVKHANPCGVASGETPHDAYVAALATDPVSAFGGIIAFNCTVDEVCVLAVIQHFVEVLIAPQLTPEAEKILRTKPNIRVLLIEYAHEHNAWDYKRIGGGILIQDSDIALVNKDQLRVVTQKKPSAKQIASMLFAWRVAKFVKSNAVIFVKDERTLGIGAGQMSRVDSARIATYKATEAGLSLTKSVVASDAFFPFRDGLDVVLNAGAQCVIQPGGSIRDDEVIAAADERGAVMVFTGERHFRH